MFRNPNSFYDIFANDYLRLSYMAPVQGNFGINSGVSFYPTPTPMEQASAFLPCNQVPVLQQHPASIPRIPSTGSSTSASSLSSGLSSNAVSQPSQELDSESDHAQPITMPSVKGKVKVRVRRTRGPNTKPVGTGYTEMMERLSVEVQEALQRDYANCCEVVKKKDNSTVHKHQLSNNHFNKVDRRLYPKLPCFICPAYIAMHPRCTTAKAGRYDSTERHCKKCAGYQEMKLKVPVFPIEITKGEFRSLQGSRKAVQRGKEINDPVSEGAIVKLLDMLLGNITVRDVESSSDSGSDVADGQHDDDPLTNDG
ncbi:hypothetical protein F5148DRAFT_20784 [Russula earlei]|uniref:Uncharacterized protein n=1 Tax=Russula earlei TaxID=71964 RepID=A0ACC0U8T2_9AGAM|nr:hypothetical protein F5148DRAFT_20784 [Russula earlei]